MAVFLLAMADAVRPRPEARPLRSGCKERELLCADLGGADRVSGAHAGAVAARGQDIAHGGGEEGARDHHVTAATRAARGRAAARAARSRSRVSAAPRRGGG